MPRFVRSQLAKRDILEIWDYICDDNMAAADALLDRFEARFRGLAQFPLSGRERPELGRNLRSVPEGEYLIVYRPIDDGVEIVRVIHGKRDFQKLF